MHLKFLHYRTASRQPRVRTSLDGIVSDDVRRKRSLCQGGGDAPKVFNHVLDDDVMAFVALCRKRGWGVPIKTDLSVVYIEFLPI